MATDTTPQDVMNERDAARYIGMSSSWLRQARCFDRPEQPPYIRMPGGAIRYMKSDLDAWLASRRYSVGEAV